MKLFLAAMACSFTVLLPFQVWDGLFFTTQTSKVLFLGWSVVIFGAIGGVYYFLTGRPERLAFTATDLLLSLFLLYTVVHVIWIRPVQLNPLFVLQWMTLAALYIIFRTIEGSHRLLLMLFIMVAAVAQAVYGNLQLYGIFPSYHNLFKLTGSFFNPGPYSGYLVSVLPFAVGLYIKSSCVRVFYCLSAFQQTINLRNLKPSALFSNAKPSNGEASNISNAKYSNPSIRETLICIIAITTIISIVLVLPAGRSRAAWVAGAISALYLFGAKEKVSALWHKFGGTNRRKWLFYALISLTVLTIASGLYLMKKGSADGRVLIWKVTLDAIKEQPLWGHGVEKFKAFYMDDQAGYFENHSGRNETAVAADNIYAFNEPLRLASETGMIGLALVFLVIWSAFLKEKTSHRKQYPDNLALLSRASLLSILIFGLFSYPAEIVPIMVNVMLYLAIISGSQQPILTIPVSAKLRNPFLRLAPTTAIIIIAILTSQQLYSINYAYTKWNEAYNSYNMGAYEDATDEYEKTYTQLKNNGDYLINYGKALSMAGKHQIAIEILERSKGFLNNTILYTALGDSYKTTGQTAKAEAAYLHAWNMVPSRFYPKYLLAKLYDETGQHEKAIAIAKELLSKEVKIESTAVKEIQEEMKKIIEKQDSVQYMFNKSLSLTCESKC